MPRTAVGRREEEGIARPTKGTAHPGLSPAPGARWN